MINLLKADIYKLLKSRAVIICLILNMIYAITSIIAISCITKLSQLKGDQEAGLNGISCITQSQSWAGVIALIIAIAVTIFVTTEFSYGTMKYSIAKGYSRTEIYFSNLISASVLTSIMLLSYVVITTATATVLWGFGDFNPEIFIGSLNVIGIQLLLYISLAAFSLMISMLIKNSGGAIALNLMTLVLLVNLLCKAIDFIGGNKFDSSIYWIMSNMSMLTNPMPEMIDVSRGVLVAVGYFSISTLIGCAAFNRYEFK